MQAMRAILYAGSAQLLYALIHQRQEGSQLLLRPLIPLRPSPLLLPALRQAACHGWLALLLELGSCRTLQNSLHAPLLQGKREGGRER